MTGLLMLHTPWLWSDYYMYVSVYNLQLAQLYHIYLLYYYWTWHCSYQPKRDSVSTLKLRTFMQVYVCPYLTRTESNGSNSERSSKLTVVLTSSPHDSSAVFILFFLFLHTKWTSCCSFDRATLFLHPFGSRKIDANTLRTAIFDCESRMCCDTTQRD